MLICWDLLGVLLDTILSFLSINIIPFLLILSILVFVHEMGHYLIAIRNGVMVEVFSIGFGKELFGWTDARGTRWKFSLVPLGGYVKMFSDLNAASQPDNDKISVMSEEDKAKSLFHKTVWQRMAVSFGGPFANYLFAVFLLSGLYMTVGQRVPAENAKIGMVVSGSAAHRSGLLADDVVIAVEGVSISQFSDLQKIISDSPAKEMRFKVLRASDEIELNVTPDAVDVESRQAWHRAGDCRNKNSFL
jgi:regulator of sigma E protease